MTEDTERLWADAGLTPAERAEAFAHHMWLNRMHNVFDLAEPTKRYEEIRNECQEGIEAALADAAPKWIPVADRLPDTSRHVAVIYYHDDERIVSEGFYSDIHNPMWFGEAPGIPVTHWAELPDECVPEPPQSARGK